MIADTVQADDCRVQQRLVRLVASSSTGWTRIAGSTLRIHSLHGQANMADQHIGEPIAYTRRPVIGWFGPGSKATEKAGRLRTVAVAFTHETSAWPIARKRPMQTIIPMERVMPQNNISVNSHLFFRRLYASVRNGKSGMRT